MFGLKFSKRRHSRLLAALWLLLALSSCRVEKQEYWYKEVDGSEYEQEDRIGLTYLKQVFIGFDELQNELRLGDVDSDRVKLTPLIEEAVVQMRTSVDSALGADIITEGALTPLAVAERFSPNVLKLDLSKDPIFKNGNGFSIQDEDGFDAMVESVLARDDLNDTIVAPPKNLIISKFPHVNRPH